MDDWESCKMRFELIAAKAKMLASNHIRPWASDIQQAATEINRLLNEISQTARSFEAGDR